MLMLDFRFIYTTFVLFLHLDKKVCYARRQRRGKVFHSPVEILVTGWSRKMGLDLVFRIR